MSLSKDLENLKYVKDVFSQLAAGRHIDASADAEWWNALQGEYKDDYAILFKGCRGTRSSASTHSRTRFRRTTCPA